MDRAKENSALQARIRRVGQFELRVSVLYQLDGNGMPDQPIPEGALPLLQKELQEYRIWI